MVLSRGLMISLGVSALGCTLLFLYFRNKMTSVERKVDIMFDLIQNHQQLNTSNESRSNESRSNESNTSYQEVVERTYDVNPDLIQVSEDSDSDSEEISDSEDEYEQPKLSLDKSEIMSLSVSDIKKITVRESDKVIVDSSVVLEEVEDAVDSLDEMDDEDEESLGFDTQKVTVVKSAGKMVDETVDEDCADGANGSDGTDVSGETDKMDWAKLKVSELKQLAKAKGLLNYKSLKKNPLIDLLKSSE